MPFYNKVTLYVTFLGSASFPKSRVAGWSVPALSGKRPLACSFVCVRLYLQAQMPDAFEEPSGLRAVMVMKTVIAFGVDYRPFKSRFSPFGFAERSG